MYIDGTIREKEDKRRREKLSLGQNPEDAMIPLYFTPDGNEGLMVSRYLQALESFLQTIQEFEDYVDREGIKAICKSINQTSVRDR